MTVGVTGPLAGDTDAGTVDALVPSRGGYSASCLVVPKAAVVAGLRKGTVC